MELFLPIVALGSLYFISNQQQNRVGNYETFANNATPQNSRLPNVNTFSRNYPDDSVEIYDLDRTDMLARQNINDDGTSEKVFTDRFFDPPNNTQNDSKESFVSLTGESVPDNYYQHGNMVPFFGGKVRGLAVNENSFESTMDSYTGAGSQHITKKEQTPLFEPLKTNQHQNGMPIMNDFIQERVSGNLSNRMDGVKPFEQIQIAPGVGLGGENNNGSKDGYNNTMMMRETWQDKNVDELRNSSKPKSSEYSLLGYETPHSRIQNMNAAAQGIQEKNRPDTSFEMGTDRLFTSMGAFGQQATVQPQLVEKFVNRTSTDENSSYIGTGHSGNGEFYNDGKFMEPHRQQLDSIPISQISAAGKGNILDGEYGLSGMNVLPNSRTANSQSAGGENNNYFGVLGGKGAQLLQAMILPIQDLVRPTRKAKTNSDMRIYGSAKGTGRNYVFDPENDLNKASVTNREIQNVDTLSRPNINRGQTSNGFEITNVEFNKTARETQLGSYFGNNNSEVAAQSSFSANYNQRNNETKSSTNFGYTPSGNASTFNTEIGATRMPTNSVPNINREMVANSSSTKFSPSIDNLGNSSKKDSAKEWDTFNKDRNSKDLLLSFLNNPYTTPSFSKM